MMYDYRDEFTKNDESMGTRKIIIDDPVNAIYVYIDNVVYIFDKCEA